MPFDLFNSAACSLLKEEVLSFTEDKSFDSGGIIAQWVATCISYALRRVGHWDSARDARRVGALFVIQKGPSAGLSAVSPRQYVRVLDMWYMFNILYYNNVKDRKFFIALKWHVV